ncbi:MAG TPA: RNA polymerase sigma factor [Gaiellaceae bacterium]|nr:RNA polymerase sigma factor [Gaiellaceae bacterium]
MTVAATEEGPRLDGRRSAERELELLYVRHAEDVRRQIRTLLRNPSDVEDALQQTFLKALRALQSGIRPERPRQWLHAIARNECLMQFRAEARRPAQVVLEEAVERAPSPDGPRAEEIREALAQLRPTQRAALVLRELEGRGYAEIAARLGISSSAVETLLFRARRALREQLATAGGCDEAAALLAAATLTEAQSGSLRAHLRSCSACAALERRRRGRLAAVRRIASLVPVPGWLSPLLGGGKAAVAVAVAAVAAGGAAEVVRTEPAPARPATARAIVHRDAPRRPAASRPGRVVHVTAAAPRRAKPAPRATRPRDGIVEPVERLPRARPAPGIAPLPDPPIEHPPPRPAPKRPAPPPPVAAQPAAPPAAEPERAPSPPAATATVAVASVPSETVPVPAATVPSETTLAVTTPAVTTPTVTVTTPAIAAPQVTATLPQPPSLTQP